ncbi:MAG: MFS transporter [Candidatus Pacebacteria bacterium]|nr:MFS transporter [Candidatus Paceibacterota bacterium]
MSFSAITKKPLFVIYSGAFLYSLHLALTLYINSSFLATYFSDSITGILFSASAVLTIVGLSFLPHVLKKFGEKKTLIFGMIVNFVLLGGLFITEEPLLIALFFVLYFSMNSLALFGIDIAIEDVSEKKNTGSLRGLFLTLKHVALMAAPVVAGLIISTQGYHVVYGFAAIAMLLCIMMFARIKKIPDPAYQERSLMQTIRLLHSERDMMSIFSANFLLQLFYAWMVIYVPIHLIQNLGMEWSSIGGLVTIMLSAFVLLSYPLGKLSDRKGLARPILIAGFLIMMASVIIIPFITTSSFIVWAIILLCTRIGAVAVEVTTETYFFSHTSNKDVSSLSLFRDTQPLAYLFGPLVATLIIAVSSLQIIFIVLSVLLLCGTLISSRLPHAHHLS